MRRRIVGTIYRKELRESLRDRRTLIMMGLVPMLLYPLLIIGTTKLIDVQSEASEARASRVAIWGTAPAPLLERLKSDKEIELVAGPALPSGLRAQMEAGSLQPPPKKKKPKARQEEKPDPDTPLVLAARPVILDRSVDAILLMWPGSEKALEQGRLGHISVLFDSVRGDSAKARERLAEDLEDARKALVAGRERDRGLAPGFGAGFESHEQNVASGRRRSGFFLGMVLPFALVIMSVTGGFYSAIDLTAGEKERGTMQTLLCAPLTSTEMILGKFLAVWTISLIATLVNICSMAATFGRISMPGMSVHVAPSAFVLSFVVLLPITLMVTALYLGLAAFARDFKDGQNYLTPLMLGLMAPLSASMVPGIELNAWTVFVPVANIALLIKALFLGEAHASFVFLAMLSSMMYAAVTVVFAGRVFARESLLLGGHESLSSMFTLKRRPGTRPMPSTALLVFATILVSAFYGSLAVRNAGTATAVIVIEYVFFLGPTLAAVLVLGFPVRDTLALRLPTLSGALASALLGLSAWTVAGGLLVRLLPPPESLQRALQDILLLDRKPVSLWVVWLIIAVTPALCEETFFRGLALSAFRSWGKWPAIATTALLFGLAHSSIYRLLPTMFLGLAFGYAVWKTRSLFCGVIAHMLNNGLMAMLARPGFVPDWPWLRGATFLPWPVVLVGSAIAVLAVLLLHRLPEPANVVR